MEKRISTEGRDMIWSTEKSKFEGYYYYCRLSQAFDSLDLGRWLVDFVGDGYKNYLDDSVVYDNQLSLISLCHKNNIEPMDVMEMKIQYYVYLKMDFSLLDSTINRLKKAEDLALEKNRELVQVKDDMYELCEKMMDFVNSKQKDSEKLRQLKRDMKKIIIEKSGI